MQDTHRAVKEIYSTLHSFFGPQGWWPVYSDSGPGYHPGDFSYPRSEMQRVEIAFGAILTQQASWKNAEKALKSLINHGLLDMEKILESEREKIEELIRPSGYFRQKAERILGFSSYVLENHGSLQRMFSQDIDALREELLSIKGIGKETADSIILYSAKKPIFVVDAYTYRIMERLGIIGRKDYDEVQELFHASLKRDLESYNEYHALLVELGKNFCRKKPFCADCPLKEICPYNKKS